VLKFDGWAETLIEYQRTLESSESFHRGQEWMKDCAAAHKTCREILGRAECGSFWPTRVIDVGTDIVSPRLVESTTRLGPYFTLSHRWTRKGITSMTKGNLESWKRCINIESLSHQFQDAIHITHQLGARYLWIDSLCIIQDSKEDWEIECTRMADIYQNSALNIAISSTPHDPLNENTSCFKEEVHEIAQIRMAMRTEDTSESVDATRVYLYPDSLFTRHDLAVESLFTRGWVFQERLLSPRMLEYSNQEIRWRCKEISDCPCTNIHQVFNTLSPSLQKSIDALIDGAFVPDLLETWNNLIYKDYTRLGFTFNTDILPALTGIASLFQKQLNDTYLAGLWQKSLPRSLLWHRDKSAWLRKHPQDSLPSPRAQQEYIAPTWSWASAPGLANSEDVLIQGYGSWTRLARMKGAKCALHGSNIYGRVSDGYLVLAAPLRPVGVHCYKYDEEYGYTQYSLKPVPAVDDMIRILELDYNFEGHLDTCVQRDGKGVFEGESYWKLSIAVQEGLSYDSDDCYVYALLLRRARRDKRSFERIGVHREIIPRKQRSMILGWRQVLGPVSTVKIL
jgi:hypothetical protein